MPSASTIELTALSIPLFKSTIHTTLADILFSKKTISYDGTLIGALLYSPSLIIESIQESMEDILKEVQKYNITSLHMSSILVKAFRDAIINGTTQGYTLGLFEDIVSQAKQVVPDGVPEATPATSRQVAMQLVQQEGRSLNSGFYGNRSMQEKIRHTHLLATDTDRCLKVIT